MHLNTILEGFLRVFSDVSRDHAAMISIAPIPPTLSWGRPAAVSVCVSFQQFYHCAHQYHPRLRTETKSIVAVRADSYIFVFLYNYCGKVRGLRWDQMIKINRSRADCTAELCCFLLFQCL